MQQWTHFRFCVCVWVSLFEINKRQTVTRDGLYGWGIGSSEFTLYRACDLHFHSCSCSSFHNCVFAVLVASVSRLYLLSPARDVAAIYSVADGCWALPQLIDRVYRGLNQPQVELVGFSVDSPASPSPAVMNGWKVRAKCVQWSVPGLWCGWPGAELGLTAGRWGWQ